MCRNITTKEQGFCIQLNRLNAEQAIADDLKYIKQYIYSIKNSIMFIEFDDGYFVPFFLICIRDIILDNNTSKICVYVYIYICIYICVYIYIYIYTSSICD